MDVPVITVSTTLVGKRVEGTITLGFGILAPGERAVLRLAPLSAVLEEFLREPCIELSEEEAVSRARPLGVWDDPPDRYDPLYGPERLAIALAALGHTGEPLIIAEDPDFYERRKMALTREAVVLTVGTHHAMHCANQSQDEWVSRALDAILQLGLISPECWFEHPQEPCRFALRLTLEGPEQQIEALAELTENLAARLQVAYTSH